MRSMKFRLFTAMFLGGVASVIGAGFAMAEGHSFKVLYRFCEGGGTCPDGQNPRGGLVADVKGNLYGTTYSGGASRYYGVAFELQRQQNGTYKYKVIHDFGLTLDDSADPVGPMFFDDKGNLYGATIFGGPSELGTIFKLTPNKNPDKKWSEQIVYNFCPTREIGCAASPIEGVTYAGAATGKPYDGKSPLYGVTWIWDGENIGPPGAIYQFQPGPGFQAIHVFGDPQGKKDGSQPMSRPVLDSAGNLYGTTPEGGTHLEAGMVYKFETATTDWTESLIHRFCKSGKVPCADGEEPFGGLAQDVTGNLYGTTRWGGAKCSADGNIGCGTVYRLTQGTRGWKEKVLHVFCQSAGCTDGYEPKGAVLIGDQAELFGTTELGGNTQGGTTGGGTLFELRGSKFKVLHAFCAEAGCADGASPTEDLIRDGRGDVFGTTPNGGAGNNGVVYEAIP